MCLGFFHDICSVVHTSVFVFVLFFIPSFSFSGTLPFMLSFSLTFFFLVVFQQYIQFLFCLSAFQQNSFFFLFFLMLSFRGTGIYEHMSVRCWSDMTNGLLIKKLFIASLTVSVSSSSNTILTQWNHYQLPTLTPSRSSIHMHVWPHTHTHKNPYPHQNWLYIFLAFILSWTLIFSIMHTINVGVSIKSEFGEKKNLQSWI